jgi:hypothetical protein
MPADPDSANCATLRETFEGREAIYVEKGVLRVRVVGIRWDADARRIDAQVEEVSAPGMERSAFHARQGSEAGPVRWDISAGCLTTFSEDSWHMGYGGWSLFFGPRVIEGVMRLASARTREMDAFDLYRAAVRYLIEEDAYGRCRRVFSSPAQP